MINIAPYFDKYMNLINDINEFNIKLDKKETYLLEEVEYGWSKESNEWTMFPEDWGLFEKENNIYESSVLNYNFLTLKDIQNIYNLEPKDIRNIKKREFLFERKQDVRYVVPNNLILIEIYFRLRRRELTTKKTWKMIEDFKASIKNKTFDQIKYKNVILSSKHIFLTDEPFILEDVGLFFTPDSIFKSIEYENFKKDNVGHAKLIESAYFRLGLDKKLELTNRFIKEKQARDEKINENIQNLSAGFNQGGKIYMKNILKVYSFNVFSEDLEDILNNQLGVQTIPTIAQTNFLLSRLIATNSFLGNGIKLRDIDLVYLFVFYKLLDGGLTEDGAAFKCLLLEKIFTKMGEPMGSTNISLLDSNIILTPSIGLITSYSQSMNKMKGFKILNKICEPLKINVLKPHKL